MAVVVAGICFRPQEKSRKNAAIQVRARSGNTNFMKDDFRIGKEMDGDWRMRGFEDARI
jgi:hypothetical protein